MSLPSCCFKGFKWDGTPTGREGKLANNPAYITGNNPDAAVLLVHDIYGWTFPNVRLLADHYASEGDLTVYVPDFFAGEVLPFAPIMAGTYEGIDLGAFLTKNSREAREPEVFECARALRKTCTKVGAAGFCYGGWAVLRLAAKEHRPPLVDCVMAGHPSLLVERDVDDAAVPVQMLAPELDEAFTPELKSYTFQKFMTLGVPFDYQHFPGVEHSCFIRGDPNKAGEREAMARGKNAALGWFAQFLKDT